jgi:hypothetical protein
MSVAEINASAQRTVLLCRELDKDRETHMAIISDPSVPPDMKRMAFLELSRITTLKANFIFLAVTSQFGLVSIKALGTAIQTYGMLDASADPARRTVAWGTVQEKLSAVLAEAGKMSGREIARAEQEVMKIKEEAIRAELQGRAAKAEAAARNAEAERTAMDIAYRKRTIFGKIGAFFAGE